MSRPSSHFRLTRRRFAFWVGMGLFSLSEKLQADVLDDFAAAAMHRMEPTLKTKPLSTPLHWTGAENSSWRWFERENLIDGKWILTGITTPVNKQTGERVKGRKNYIDERLVPDEVRFGSQATNGRKRFEEDAGQPSEKRRARHGRPPSRWLRSLNTQELRIWLETIEVSEVGVDGMTFWEHLTRDHSFEPDRIEGLTVDEQAKLHAAAHDGY